MKTHVILIGTAIAVIAIVSQAQAQTFQTNNGVIIGSPGVLPPPANDGRAIIPTDPDAGRLTGGRLFGTNRLGTNLSNLGTNNFGTNVGMFPGTNTVRRVPISSNIPSTSIQPPDSSLPPMTNAPGQRFQPRPPGTATPQQPGATPSPTPPSTPPVRK